MIPKAVENYSIFEVYKIVNIKNNSLGEVKLS